MNEQQQFNKLQLLEIPQFLTVEECIELLNRVMDNFTAATSHYPNYYRTNDRYVEENEPLAAKLLTRLQIYLQSNNLSLDPKISGINPRLRYCKYQRDQHFSKHQDGIYFADDHTKSAYSFVLYLNPSHEYLGGTTSFYKQQDSAIPCKIIQPTQGKLIVFDHHLWHSGDSVIQGIKFVLRTDLLVDDNSEYPFHRGYIWTLLQMNGNIISAGRDGMIKMWNRQLTRISAFKAHTLSVVVLRAVGPEEYLSCSRDFTIKKWHSSGKLLASLVLDEMIISAKRFNNQYVLGGTRGTLYFTNTELILKDSIQLHRSWIWALFSVKNHLLTCGGDGMLKKVQPDKKRTSVLVHWKEALCCINQHRNSLVLGTDKGSLLLLRKNYQIKRVFKLHTRRITAILPYKDGVLSASEDGAVSYLDLKNNKSSILIRQEHFIQAISILENQLYIAGYEGVISQLDLTAYS